MLFGDLPPLEMHRICASILEALFERARVTFDQFWNFANLVLHFTQGNLLNS
jgi:hypothetical protein